MEQHLLFRYTKFLNQVLTPARFQHSLGVMQVMEELASVYGLDLEIASITGLLHDAAKDLSPSTQRQLVVEAAIIVEYPCEQDYVLYLHGPVGAYFVHKTLGVTNTQILDAIRMHCFTAKSENFNSPLAWCLRFSDILEPNRVYDVSWFRAGMPRLKQTVYEGRLAEAAFLQTGWIIKMWEEKGFPIHPNIRQAHQEFAAQLNLDDLFLG